MAPTPASRRARWLVPVLLALLLPFAAAAGGSRHLVLASDRLVDGGPVEVLSTTVELERAGWAYLHADGGFAPVGESIANAWIEVDGRRVSNESVVDWRGSRAPNRRAFNAIAAVHLPAGRSRVALRARAVDGTMRVTARSSLSVLTHAAEHAATAFLDAHSPWLEFDTRGTAEGQPLPRGRGWMPVLSVEAGNAGGPVVAMASGRAWTSNRPGDAMWGIFLNGREPPLHSTTWSINDLFEGAELQAPMFMQALFPAPPRGSSVQLVASESPYYTPRMSTTNAVRYRVGAGTGLVTLSGGMRVVGRGYAPAWDYVTRGRYRRYAYVCIGTNGFRPDRCPPTGTAVVLARGLACVPSGHDGEVMFASRTRIQGDDHDAGGTVALSLRVGGREVARNLQVLGPHPHAVSTRTIGTSWLSAGARALREGCHVVEAVAEAHGDFRNVSLNADLPLLWFD
ncbi:MAG TPA: hypothetical protein VIG97_11350 [Luteimonas sp.]